MIPHLYFLNDEAKTTRFKSSYIIKQWERHLLSTPLCPPSRPQWLIAEGMPYPLYDNVT